MSHKWKRRLAKIAAYPAFLLVTWCLFWLHDTNPGPWRDSNYGFGIVASLSVVVLIAWGVLRVIGRVALWVQRHEPAELRQERHARRAAREGTRQGMRQAQRDSRY